ncbi:hypothetical protein COY05_00055 [Candidatus Peregrinibacteria bacterium CG_4_10_14_0_2_um_filter_38_24]|nr:MAG: hypothetical protein COY05_00055 [Candidatus Peregrinibacteria bacterium CG_4_10_14_0_2_um_filter_38_24]PJC39160.1 MAG: hypothetical protein CO044_01190 [Candidatus Peregrinibacteria bacterium CG_4_9_14_0_2_um_filter_38_9]
MAKQVSSKNYLVAVTAALVAIAVIASSFIYSLVKDSDDYAVVDIAVSENNTVSVNPNGNNLPDHAPDIEPPATKPPTE